MSRALGIAFLDAVYHVTSRGNERKVVFRDDEDGSHRWIWDLLAP